MAIVAYRDGKSVGTSARAGRLLTDASKKSTAGKFPGILENPRNPALTWESSERDYYREVWFPQVILGVSQSDTVKIRSRKPEYPCAVFRETALSLNLSLVDSSPVATLAPPYVWQSVCAMGASCDSRNRGTHTRHTRRSARSRLDLRPHRNVAAHARMPRLQLAPDLSQCHAQLPRSRGPLLIGQFRGL